jgi:hypothetical protein
VLCLKVPRLKSVYNKQSENGERYFRPLEGRKVIATYLTSLLAYQPSTFYKRVCRHPQPWNTLACPIPLNEQWQLLDASVSNLALMRADSEKIPRTVAQFNSYVVASHLASRCNIIKVHPLPSR